MYCAQYTVAAMKGDYSLYIKHGERLCVSKDKSISNHKKPIISNIHMYDNPDSEGPVYFVIFEPHPKMFKRRRVPSREYIGKIKVMKPCRNIENCFDDFEILSPLFIEYADCKYWWKINSQRFENPCNSIIILCYLKR